MQTPIPVRLVGDQTGIIGTSPWATQTRHAIRTIAGHSATVLITGPSGTGKELVARAIHACSPRRQQPFVPVDCASASGTLFAGQLFGHDRGAFTGATHASLGAFRAADGGTLFLDELGELEVELQGKLLRALQERAVVPLGAVQPIPIDVRIVAATNRDLASEVATGRFREDLYYRLNVVNLHSTPLASRREDLPLLIEFLCGRMEVRHGIAAKPISPAAHAILMAYHWPGNVRELDNVLERAHLFSAGPVIEPHHLPERLLSRLVDPAREAGWPTSPSRGTAWPTMEQVTRRHLVETLEHTEFNQTQASELLGLDRHALRRMARRLSVDLSSSRPGRPSQSPR